jgi:uncharacterized protein DUF4338
VQGRRLSEEDLAVIVRLIEEHPQAHRRRLSLLLCQRWEWKNERGHYKDMAARTLMRKLDGAGLIKLPPPRRAGTNARRGEHPPPRVPELPPVAVALSCLQPLRLEWVRAGTDGAKLFHGLLAHHHYLGYRGPTGEHIGYLVWSATDQPLACLLFGAAAWKVAARDQFIGWGEQERRSGLSALANNSRFLILPGVRVPSLASHILSLATARLRRDWMEKYGHPVELVETFVQRDRFAGTCYRAANWQWLGATQGRSRNDRDHRHAVPVKDLYFYPLSRFFRQRLGVGIASHA